MYRPPGRVIFTIIPLAHAIHCRDCKPVHDGEHTGMQGGRWGLIDAAGREVVPPRYDEVEGFDGATVTVTLDGKRFVIDRDGKPTK